MFRDLLDEEGHILTHNFRPIQPLGDRIILFNIIDNDDNTLDHYHPEDDIPVDIIDINNDLSDLTNAKTNVLNDSPDNDLDEDKVDSKTNKAKLDSASTTHLASLYLLSITILTFILSDRR